MNNREKLQTLLCDVFLLGPAEFNFELKREQVDTWDSLGVVSMAVGIQETFGYHITPAEATGIKSVAEVIALLERHGVSFRD